MSSRRQSGCARPRRWIVLADEALAVLHHVNEHVEQLRLDRNGVATAAELAPVGVKRVAGKNELHVAASSSRHGIIKPVSWTNQGNRKASPMLASNAPRY